MKCERIAFNYNSDYLNISTIFNSMKIDLYYYISKKQFLTLQFMIQNKNKNVIAERSFDLRTSVGYEPDPARFHCATLLLYQLVLIILICTKNKYNSSRFKLHHETELLFPNSCKNRYIQ